MKNQEVKKENAKIQAKQCAVSATKGMMKTRELRRHNKSGEYIIIEITDGMVTAERVTLPHGYLQSIAHNLIQLDDFSLAEIEPKELSEYKDWE